MSFFSPGIESLFKKINCDPTFIEDMLGGQQGVTNQNMLQHLGEIERQVNQLMLCYFYQMKEKVKYDTLNAEEPNLF